MLYQIVVKRQCYRYRKSLRVFQLFEINKNLKKRGKMSSRLLSLIPKLSHSYPVKEDEEVMTSTFRFGGAIIQSHLSTAERPSCEGGMCVYCEKVGPSSAILRESPLGMASAQHCFLGYCSDVIPNFPPHHHRLFPFFFAVVGRLLPLLLLVWKISCIRRNWFENQGYIQPDYSLISFGSGTDSMHFLFRLANFGNSRKRKTIWQCT